MGLDLRESEQDGVPMQGPYGEQHGTPTEEGPVPGCVITVDVGNTSTHVGAFPQEAGWLDEPLGTFELTTPERLSADEARLQLGQALAALGCGPVYGAILSCVVPALTTPWKKALTQLCATRPYVVGPGIRTGLHMSYHDPSEVGPDRIADALAARETLGAPAIAIDLGTTVNIEAIDGRGSFAGGAIAPGLALGARALAGAAARLPTIDLTVPAHAIGKSTREAMLSGLVLGEAARIDGLVGRIEEELGGGRAPLVITGEGAAQMARLLGHEASVDLALTPKGLHMLYLTNTRDKGHRAP